MMPTVSTFNIAYGRKADAELFCNMAIQSLIFKNAPHLGFAQNCRAMGVTTILSTLANFIFHICDLIAKKQMMRIYTSRIVAGVKNMTRFWNYSAIYCPSNTMRPRHDDSGGPTGKHAISAASFESISDPRPASGLLIAPKSLLKKDTQLVGRWASVGISGRRHSLVFHAVAARSTPQAARL